MGCCGGSCSCWKSKQTPVEENIHLVQLPTSQGTLSTIDWMKGLEDLAIDEGLLEIRFKNNRKGFFRNPLHISFSKDDMVVVEAEGGHDLGMVSLTGRLAEKQFHQKASAKEKAGLGKVYRKATPVDLENWLSAKGREREVLLESRRLAAEMQLEMSIGDVEFQGDGKKVTVYYTAERRVDFRELVRKYASAFRVRVEMRQIGVRQEAAKLGGLGTCGRELCCSTWKREMNSVKTEAARIQNLSLTTSKLAGQCGKLKCCLNYELDTYLEAWEEFPSELIRLDTDRGTLMPLQPDLLKKTVLYGWEEQSDYSRYEIPVEKVKLYISLNKKGKKIELEQITSKKDLIKEKQIIHY